MSGRRLPVLVLVAVLALLIGLDAASEPARRESVAVTSPAAPIADDLGVLSSTWFCAAGSAVPDGGPANLTVVAANTTDEPLRLSVTWVPTGGAERRTDVVDLPALDTVSLQATEAIEAPAVSAIVEASGGGVLVEHVIVSPRGSSLAPCASDASDQWFLANGTTERDATQVLAVFNPFPDDAVVDIAFDTDEGRSEPRGLQGLPVAAGTTTWVRVEEHVRRRAVTAAAIVTRTGRVVVDRIQTFTGELGRTGTSLTLAAPALSETWMFPDGLHQEGLTQQWHIYNPGDETAIVLLDVVPEEGEPPEPMELTVDPRRQVIVNPATEELVPAGVPFSSTIRSINGVPVVAERLTDSRSPAPRRGWASELGSPVTADAWGFAVGETSRNTDEFIVVHNPGEVAATFSVLGLGAGQVIQIQGLQDLEVGPAQSVRIRLGERIERVPLPIVVEADGPVVVERDVFGVGRSGISTTIGIPLP